MRAVAIWLIGLFVSCILGHFIVKPFLDWLSERLGLPVREGKSGHWQGDRKQTTVWEIANNNPFGNRQREQSWGHGTQKPVECMRRPIVKTYLANRQNRNSLATMMTVPDPPTSWRQQTQGEAPDKHRS